MPDTRPTYAPGEPAWVELFTTDVEGARRFYGDLFGWTSEAAGEEYGGYVTFERDGAPVAGCMHNDGSMGPETWSVYLASDDVTATAERAREHGGQVVVEPMQVGEMGHMAFLVDPAGAGIGVWQAGQHTGMGALGAPGTPAWFETLSTDYRASTTFYRDVFGWDLHVESDSDEFRYSTLGQGEQARAGIMDASAFAGPEGSSWRFYVAVEDADAAVSRVEELGGATVHSAEDTPYGRVAVVADPAGVRFSLLGPARGDG
ncbi:VOC family protein [Nocardioides sp. GCM10027113]|uniref:VOC family protein n=1 Tax=unclassified Nocardioides TaxID=2615069 RepID=UPI00360699A3